MKETKFRAWDTQAKCMLGGGGMQINATTGRLDHLPSVIVLQFTGLLDKQGKEIYEGDIVRAELSTTQRYKGIIIFENARFLIQSFWYSFRPVGRWDMQGEPLCGRTDTKLSMDCEMKVAGNIYEHNLDGTRKT